jgi:general stress protein 26
MNEPVTELDPRFSDEDAVATKWDETRGVVESAELFWLATVRADGRPHVVPLVAVWLDGAIHFCTASTEQKAINLRANPHVVIMTGCNGWEDGLDVMIEGVAMQVTEHSVLERLTKAWLKKWDGRWKYDVLNGGFHSGEDDAELVFAVKPAKVLAFRKGKFSHTRHRF